MINEEEESEASRAAEGARRATGDARGAGDLESILEAL
jgi:hypothetical protein